jgi:two-component system sensor histidine kinase ChvG
MTSRRFRIIRASATAGTTRQAEEPKLGWRLLHSFSLQLLVLALILLTVPIVLYWQFQKAEQEQLSLLHNAVGHSGQLIAGMLRPRLEHFRSEPSGELIESLNAAAIGGTNIKLLLRPNNGGKQDFFYVAAAPSVPAAYLKEERRELVASGVFTHLATTCDRSTDLAVRFVNPAGKQEILTSMTPVHVGADCWVVITSQNASTLSPAISRPFWETPAMRMAAAVYLLSAALILWLFLHLTRNFARFRAAARRIRLRGAEETSFREVNTIPELTGVAEDFDSLVTALTDSQDFIRQTAEENTHALKAPLAVIAQSLEPIKRAVPMAETAAQRSLQLIERSIAKLDSLVSATRDLEEAVADVLYPVTRPVDLSGFLAQLTEAYDATLTAQGKHLVPTIAPGITAFANEDLMEPVIENLLENAASFTPAGGSIEVSLRRHGSQAVIRVADRGRGVDPAHLPHIFDRYASYRDTKREAELLEATETHQGLGLWIVKRNIEGLGGTVEARNREGGGFEVDVRLSIKA